MSMVTGRMRGILRRGRPEAAAPARESERQRIVDAPPIDIAPNDPALAYFQGASGAVAIDELQLDSPAVREMRAAGIKMVVPLISQGELIGLLNLGPRLSEQEYSSDDRQLLEKLASQAAPAVRVAQLVRQQEADVRARERIEQELRVAQLIQQQFLPKQLPRLQGWHVAAFYRAAQEVGGDFYDFFDLPDGKIGIVVGDVTGHGVPAALVMATTRSLIRSDAPRQDSPSAVLERANDFLETDIPANMFVTCLYAVLDPVSGTLRFANAGHDLPYVRRHDGSVVELRATGMPLGAMPGMRYDEKEATLAPGDVLLLHSDGVAEAHDPDRQMFGFPRMRELMAGHTEGQGSSTACWRRCIASPARPGSRRTTSRSSPSSEARTSGGNRPAGRMSLRERSGRTSGRRTPEPAGCSRSSRCRASRATSARSWSGSPRRCGSLASRGRRSSA